MQNRVVAVVQARMGSRRLPGKVLLKLGTRPVIWHVVNRLSRCLRVDEIVVATTAKPEDDALVRWCGLEGVSVYRGSSNDLLSRYLGAATEYRADSVLRITADCPALDSNIIDLVIDGYHQGGWDYYGLAGEYPNGLDCTIMSYQTLHSAFQSATLPSDREHVGPYIERHPARFKVGGLAYFNGHHDQRWTLDEPADYSLLNQVFERLGPTGQYFNSGQILELMESNPELKKINSHIVRNEGYLVSLSQDPKVSIKDC